MGWFWSKSKSTSPDAAVGQHLVAMASTSSAAADKERRRVEKQQAKEQKRREKELEKIAKKAMNDMKKQVKQAKKERAKAEKRVRNHARAVRKLQKKELSAQKKQAKREAKNAKRARQLQAKKAKAAVCRRAKEAKRRRKQQQELDAQSREQDELERQRVEAERDTARLRVQHDHQQNQQPVTNANDVVVTLRDAPAFKERTNCVKCTIKFKRLPKYRRHHCRHCGESFCGACLSANKRPIPWFKMDKPQKVCVTCDAQVFATPTGTTNDVAVHQQPTIAPEEPVATTPLQRSASTMSEQPEDSPRSSRSRSRSSSRFIGFRLTRSRSDNNSSKGKKSSLWSLPIRPLLKRKASQDKLRNRAWDLDLMLEKEALLARQHKSQMMLVSGAPQLAPAV